LEWQARRDLNPQSHRRGFATFLFIKSCGVWQARRDLNPQPLDLESRTLPIELLAYKINRSDSSLEPTTGFEPVTTKPQAWFCNTLHIGIRTMEPTTGFEPVTSSLPRKCSSHLSYMGVNYDIP
jgi:hypothetical protein